jgi:hypothetical protein
MKMKRNMIYSGLLLCAIALFSACGEDDNNNENIDFINQDVAGTYSGTFDITMGGMPIASGIQKDIKIAKVSDGVVSLTLSDLTLTIAGNDMPLGTIALSNCTVTPGSGSYAIKGNETLTLAVGSCPTEVNGTVKSGALDLTIDVEASVPAPGTKVSVVYKGTRK